MLDEIMDRISIGLLIGFLWLLSPVISNGDEWTRPFNDKEYRQTSKRDIRHGKVAIRIIEAKELKKSADSPHFCRAWFEVVKSKDKVFRKYFDDIEPVGFSFGLFVPKVQPPSPYFAIVKTGDYDGRLFLVRTDGKVFDLMGGFFFLTDDKRYLFSEYSSDSAGLVVFDLKAGRIVFSSDKLPYIQQWYIKDGVYFFTESEWLTENGGNSTEKKGVAYFYDFDSHRIVEKNVTNSDIDAAKSVKFDFDPRDYSDCDCTNRSRVSNH